MCIGAIARSPLARRPHIVITPWDVLQGGGEQGGQHAWRRRGGWDELGAQGDDDDERDAEEDDEEEEEEDGAEQEAEGWREARHGRPARGGAAREEHE